MNKEKIRATRQGYGEGLAELMREKSDVIALDADLAHATGSLTVQKEFPDRFIDVGIAEQNLVGMAVGLSRTGYVPFASSFAIFMAGRAGEIIRNAAAYSKANVKLVGSHAGITPVRDGGSHQCIEDFGSMRAIPNMTILSPCDYNQAKVLVKKAYEIKGPVYIRTSREGVPEITDENQQIEIGKAQLLMDGSDLCIISTGFPVSLVMEAAEKLQAEGISAAVMNMHTVKPLDKDSILEYADKCRRILVVEEHNVIGGLSEAVASTLVGKDGIKFDRIGIEDRFGQSGRTKEVLFEYGLTAENIYAHAKELIK